MSHQVFVKISLKISSKPVIFAQVVRVFLFHRLTNLVCAEINRYSANTPFYNAISILITFTHMAMEAVRRLPFLQPENIQNTSRHFKLDFATQILSYL